MNHLQNHIDNYLVHCQTQKRLDAKTLKAYRIDKKHLPFIAINSQKTHPFETFCC